ncbi:hypothetical protein GDO81_020499 [Engystomops pustulosus]|uniref:Helically-extended SH3 domain-containing protein n=1 Tax=Engystomops pustulosus TaxID=76066 RepID=A0AAV6ZEB5_ENGPU|nr:hypothetical protein GDO81_020499 [Engystomops pustulosus]
MDTEESSDFKSVRERFQSISHSSSAPPYTTREEDKPIPRARIANIRSNPALQDVIKNLESHPPAVAPPIAVKPGLPPKPNGLVNDNMKLGKGFRQTLHITDSSRMEEDKAHPKNPQMYRLSMPLIQDPHPRANLPRAHKDLENVTSINKVGIAGSKHKPPPISPKPVIMTSSPIPDVPNQKEKKIVRKIPVFKTIPPITSLGPPPSKPPRPPNVDLSPFYTESSQEEGIYNEPEDLSEAEYDLASPSTIRDESEVYDEALSPKDSTESDSNFYEVENVEYDTPEAATGETEVFSENETDEMLCYEEILRKQESGYEMNPFSSNPVSGPETVDGGIHEVTEANHDYGYSSSMSLYPNSRSSVANGHYSVDLETSNELIRHKDSKAKEGKMRKKFKITGQETMLYQSIILEDFKAEKYSLPVKKGETVEVIRITECPAGRWLARDYSGEIKIINIATINDLAPLSAKNKLELAVKPGETVEVVDVTDENQIICRNFAGKCK